MPVSPWYTGLRKLPRSSSASFRASVLSPLFPSFSKAFFRGLHTTTFVTWGFSKSYNHAAQVPSSNVTCTFLRSPRINSRMVHAFVSRMDSFTSFPGICDCNRNRFFVNIHANIFRAIHCGFAPFALGPTLKTYRKRGAPLQCTVQLAPNRAEL